MERIVLSPYVLVSEVSIHQLLFQICCSLPGLSQIQVHFLQNVRITFLQGLLKLSCVLVLFLVLSEASLPLLLVHRLEVVANFILGLLERLFHKLHIGF